MWRGLLTGLKKAFQTNYDFHFLWSVIDVVFNIPPKNRYNIVFMKYSSNCISIKDEYFHETLWSRHRPVIVDNSRMLLFMNT